MISINKDSISHINSSIPSLPMGCCGLSGAQLPNRDLVICGRDPYTKKISYTNNHYLHYKEGSNKWKKVETMKKEKFGHSSVWIDVLLTTGGMVVESRKGTSHHEVFSFKGGVKIGENMPIPLKFHTATIFDRNRIIVCGGEVYRNVSQTFSN